MKLQDSGTGSGALAGNIIAFRGGPRGWSALGQAGVPARPGKRQAAAMTGAEINARLLILLGICTTTAAGLLLAARILHG
jgi:hypothetical protein